MCSWTTGRCALAVISRTRSAKWKRSRRTGKTDERSQASEAAGDHPFEAHRVRCAFDRFARQRCVGETKRRIREVVKAEPRTHVAVTGSGDIPGDQAIDG